MKNIQKVIVTMLLSIIIIYLPGTLLADDENGKKISLDLKVLSVDHLILMPVQLEFKLTNLTANNIKNIPNIDYKYSPYGICIFISNDGIERKVTRPKRSIDNEGVIPPPLSFDLGPYQTAIFSLSLLFDWYKNKNMTLFTQPGTYVIYGTHTIPGIGVIESNRVEIEYRGPETKNEREAVNLLRPLGNALRYIYSIPMQLPGSGQGLPEHNKVIHDMVRTVRKIYEMEPPTLFKEYMRKALIQWKNAESRTIRENISKLKKRNIHKLGLQDLDLGEK